MRDLAVTAVIAVLLPFVLFRPYIGVLLWTWVGLMNPHRLAWGFAHDFSFAIIIGATTIVAILLSNEPKRFPAPAVVVALIAFYAWMVVTTIFAMFPEDAWQQLEKIAKIQLFVFITMIVMQSRDRIAALVWVSVFSIAFYGIKGGIYTIMGGGAGMVLGPDGGFIAGNTEIALALTMTVPLMRWIQMQSENRWLRWILGACMVLVAAAVLGSYSRGGLLAIAAMGAVFWAKGRNKIIVAILFAVVVPLFFALMPEQWFAKMQTIQTYEQDTSAMARLNTWQFAWNLALDHPIFGGGFQVFQPEAYARWAPDPTRVFDAHSIWFGVLAEHGFVGLAIFLLIWLLAWRLGSAIIRDTREDPAFRWATDLAAMIQVSLIGFWVGGSFLGLEYWDYPYLLVAILVLTQVVVKREQDAKQGDAVAPREPPAVGPSSPGPRLGTPG
jgi:probable O-glycosylation ligase (exosortase A-associated)